MTGIPGTEVGSEPLLPIRLNHGALGIVKEGGELLALLEKHLYYGQPLDRGRFLDELGDVLWYVSLVCNALGFDLGEVMLANARKLVVRYPEGYDPARAAEEGRDRAAEAAAQSLTRAGAAGPAGTTVET